MILTWILGSGGLLGSYLQEACSRDEILTLWSPPWRFPWGEQEKLKPILEESARLFVLHATAKNIRSFRILWAAGKGVVGSPPEELEHDTETFSSFLHVLRAQLGSLPREKSGTVFFASSAGAAYGASEGTLTEASPSSPLSAYGREKLKQEEMLRAWSSEITAIRSLIGRISTLYGRRQNLGKNQGLISHLSRCILHRRPFHLFVPLDTIRDYLHAADCARAILRCLDRLEQEESLPAAALTEAGRSITKIFAAEEVATVAEAIGVFRAITKQNLRVVSAPHPVSREHPHQMRFRSAVFPETSPQPRIRLPEGIHDLHQYQTMLYQQGALPAQQQ